MPGTSAIMVVSILMFQSFDNTGPKCFLSSMDTYVQIPKNRSDVDVQVFFYVCNVGSDF